MAAIPATTHEFRRGKVDGDGSCLYTSFRHANGMFDSINNQLLRYLVANYIRNDESLHLSVLESGTQYKTVEEYCNQIEKHNLWAGEPEVQALAMLFHKLIRLVSKTKTAQGKCVINILNYGENMELFKECVYILYDEEKKHYDYLYVVNTQNMNEISTIFQRDDEAVANLINNFVREELQGKK